MPKTLVLYSSNTGSTEKMAKAVAEGAKSNGDEVKLVIARNLITNPEEMGKYDALIFGTPTYHHNIHNDIKQVLEAVAVKNVNLKGKIGAAFGSYGWTGEAPNLVIEILKLKFEMKVTEPPLLVSFKPDNKALDLCKELGKRVSENASGKSGVTPSSEQSPVKVEQEKSEVKEMSKYACKVCGYVYDPALGEPNSGIPPGTPFEKLPDDWVCPVCGATKDQFEKVS